jgi:hypothetical protein
MTCTPVFMMEPKYASPPGSSFITTNLVEVNRDQSTVYCTAASSEHAPDWRRPPPCAPVFPSVRSCSDVGGTPLKVGDFQR